MALTQSQEQALLDMLQKWTGTQERRPVAPASLNEAVERPGTGYHVLAYDTSNGNKNLFRVPAQALGYSLSNGGLNIPSGQAINWSTANHLVSSKQLKAFYESDIKAPRDALAARVSATEAVANSAKSTADGAIPHINANTALAKAAVKGHKDGLVMDFGSLPSVTGASTVSFNKRFKGAPIVIVNFWGDVGNPRFSLARDDDVTWGIRLSATYPGVWAAIGEPV